MTDNEIIKALECCIKSSHFGECFENKCPMVSEKGCKVGKEGLYPYTFDLINRQKAEIDELEKRHRQMVCQLECDLSNIKAREEHIGVLAKIIDEQIIEIKNAKSEAIKEFAERLKEKVSKGICDYDITEIVCEIIDNLVKEMTEQRKEDEGK